MDVQWMVSPYSLSLDDLYAQDAACPLMHNEINYVGVLRIEPDIADIVGIVLGLPIMDHG